jgi:hypothetical protein
MRRSALIALLACGSALFPAAASATVLAPPGNSAVQQYVENVPSAAGTVPAKAQHGKSRVSPRAAHSLAAQGKDGKAVAALAAATAPPSGPSGPGSGRQHAGDSGTQRAAGPIVQALPAASVSAASESTPHAVLRAVSGTGGGIGALLPVLLGASVVAALLTGLRRRRTLRQAE